MGVIVQNNSNEWDSSILTPKFFIETDFNKLNLTIVTIKIKIVIVWLWKKINCSIKGEFAFWKLRHDHEGILTINSKKDINLIFEF